MGTSNKYFEIRGSDGALVPSDDVIQDVGALGLRIKDAYIGGIINANHLSGSNAQINFVPNSSGDGYGFTTIELIPDTTTGNSDQTLIIDPTAPNHVHIRAGGTIDNSNAVLLLGGENSHVRVENGPNPPVTIKSNNKEWNFGADGYLYLPVGDSTTAAISFPNDPAGGSGDGAQILWSPISGENMKLEMYVRNDAEDEISLNTSGPVRIKTAMEAHTWSFDVDGNITLPAGGDIKDSGGNSVLTGSGGGGGPSYFYNSSGTTIYTTSSATIFAGNTGITSSSQLLGGGEGIVLAVTGGATAIYNDMYVVGNLYDANTQKKYTTAGLGDVSSTSSVGTSSVSLQIGTSNNSSIWTGDIFVAGYSTYSLPATPDTWVLTIPLPDNITEITNVINGTSYSLVADYGGDPGAWVNAMKTGNSTVINDIVITGGGGSPVVITYTAVVNEHPTITASVTGSSSTFDFTGQSGGGTDSSFISQKIINATYLVDPSSNVMSLSSATSSFNLFGGLPQLTNSVISVTSSTGGALKINITGISGYTINWSAYAVGQKVISL